MRCSYLSSKERSIKGEIKQEPSDFAVEEIMPDGTVLELDKTLERPNTGSQFVHFILQKQDWSTSDAAREIASRLHISPKRVNYAGTKDKKALTTQLMSAFGARKDAVLGLKINGMRILGAWHADEKVDLGMLLGNRFKIRVDGGIDETDVRAIAAELDGKFPNYFGPQRFGSTRANTHVMGEKLLRNDLRGAVETYLMGGEGETNAYATEARKQLREEKDYRKALQYFPKHLKLERLMLLHLAEHPYDYANALRKLPRQILLLFVHAFQSHLFNLMLSERLGEGALEPEEGEYFCGERLGFPDLDKKIETGNRRGWLAGRIIGYETELNEREREMLERLEIRKEDFKMRPLPEINSKGTYRTLLAPMKDFHFYSKNEEFSSDCRRNIFEYKDGVFSFSLPSGSYATSALREFIKDLW